MSNFEVRDEEDTEVKQYAYDKNIVEVFVDKENNVTSMEVHIFKMMERVLEFLKKASLLAPHTSARFVNQMTILSRQNLSLMKGQYRKFEVNIINNQKV